MSPKLGLFSFIFREENSFFNERSVNSMTLNYAYIVLGNITIEGWIDCYEWRNDTIIIVIDGVKYQTAKSNVLLMYKPID